MSGYPTDEEIRNNCLPWQREALEQHYGLVPGTLRGKANQILWEDPAGARALQYHAGLIRQRNRDDE